VFLIAGLLPASTTPVLAATPIFINEIHYDNASTDSGEAIEIAGPAGTSLTGWTIVLYNGETGLSYSTATLSGSILDPDGDGFGVASVSYSVNGIQNGPADAIALVNGLSVVQFLSYEGTLTALNGPANGLTSTDIGVSEVGTEPIGRSIGLTGSGTTYEDFVWTTNLAASISLVNPGQVFGATSTNPTGVGFATPDSVAPGGSSLLTVAVTPGTNPASTGLAVTADLSSIGGSATQSFFDDATHGDAVAGNNVFSFQATVDAGTGPGSKSLAATITDSQSRSGSATISLAVTTPPPPPGSVVISEVYGGGGNSGATLRNDFIELFNRTGSPVSVAGWSVQYAAAGGTGTWGVTALTGMIPANGYYLVQEAAGTGGSLNLPNPDVTGMIAMSATAGKVILVAQTAALNGACPTNPLILDKVGYGAANCFEGAPTPGLANATSASRNGGGSVDTDNNLADFTIGDPTPRGATEPGPQVLATFPTHTGIDAATQTNLSVTFSEPVDVAGAWFTIACATSGSHSAGFSGGPTVFILDPVVDFAPNEVCTLTVVATQVTDQDTDDPSDAMATNFVATFTTGAVENCGDPATLISAAQGSGFATPIAGTSVSIEAVVVSDVQATPGQFGGFHLQEQDADADGDPATSEGIFVFHGLAGLPVASGDVVRVRGPVTEFSGLTEVSPVRRIIVCSSGASVSPATVDLPVDAFDELESVESMRVDLDQTLTVTEVFNLGRFGEVSLSGTGRLPNPTNVVAPGPAAVALEDLNDRSRIILDDASNFQNVDPTLYPQGGLSASNTLRVGDSVDGVAGVLEERFGGYRIQPVGAIEFDHDNPRTAAPEAVGGNLRVASFNVLNFFNGDGMGGGFPTPRGATNLAELQRQLAKEVSAITTLDGDIVGLMELENDALGNSAIEDLVTALNAEAGPGTYSFIDTGVVGTDEIRVALLYQPAVVTPVGDFAVIDGSVDPRFIDTRNRPSLAQTFELNATGARLTVVVNHLKSKGSGCQDIGDPDTGDGQGNCNGTRTQAAEAIVDWLATDPTGSNDPDYLLIGDMNSYAREDPITAFKSAGFVDAINAHIGAGAYSYVFEGESGYLDHALASSSLAAQLSDVTEWHINPDEPTVLDYNVEFKTANQVNTFYDPGPYRSSDHDPVLVGLDLNAAPTVDAGGPYAVIEGASVVVSATGSDPDLDPLTYAWDLDDDGIFETSGQAATFSAAALPAPGTHTIRVEVSDGLLTARDTATVDVIWDFSGFFQPVDNTPTLNVAKAGAGVPIKFSLDGDQGLDIIATGYPTSIEFDCDATAPTDAIETTSSAGGTGLTYDAATGVYTYKWKTHKSWSNTCRRFVVKLADGTFHYADFEFVK
jgi:predicted extracellular nuclease